MTSNTFAEVVRFLSEDFGIDPKKVTSQALVVDDLGLDSIDAVDLMVRFQEVTGKKVTPEQFMKIKTVEDLVTLIDDLKK